MKPTRFLVTRSHSHAYTRPLRQHDHHHHHDHCCRCMVEGWGWRGVSRGVVITLTALPRAVVPHRSTTTTTSPQPHILRCWRCMVEGGGVAGCLKGIFSPSQRQQGHQDSITTTITTTTKYSPLLQVFGGGWRASGCLKGVSKNRVESQLPSSRCVPRPHHTPAP